MRFGVARLMTGACVLSLCFAGAALAGDDTKPGIPKERQQKLLQQYGDQGIDADGDGVLTREEVRTFLSEMRGGKGKGERKRGKDGPRGDRQADADEPIAEAIQAKFLARYGEEGIDGDENGTLTRGEVRRFFGGERPGQRGGRRGGPARGPRGQRSRGGDGLGRIMGQLERLDAETAPKRFNLERFPEADADGDGALGNDEWRLYAAEQHERLLTRLVSVAPQADTDKNGAISDEELAKLKADYEVRQRDRVLALNPEADTNQDASISDEEYEAFRKSRDEQRRARMLERFPEADTDGNGKLSEEEMEAFRGARGGRDGMMRRGGPRGSRRGGGGEPW